MVLFQVLCRSLRCLVDQFEVFCRTLWCLVRPCRSFAVFKSFAVFSRTGLSVTTAIGID